MSNNLYNCCCAQFTFVTDPAFWESVRFLCRTSGPRAELRVQPLYSPEEKRRRDETPWTTVQGVLAPLQFLAFLISLALVARCLVTGEGYWIATCSVVAKTLLLYTIMITGSIWERVVFGRYLFAPAFFWEDVFSILVLALHTAYLVVLIGHIGSPQQQMLLVLAAYASYAVNATQFLLKLRAARIQQHSDQSAQLFAEVAK
ncbi:2-vinyl bacteriochlorophyllide hydratase [Bradyrhizobium jicamae]|uniref:2-vinyl bacteriochlorophyllide hydratase n=1 Tax=Bradyrhizobium jicamae TaxID=280332 RepID=UPI00201109E0|nr:2-vinyl bacteriochlorophyllide hydratase [Bradyrhizobium jicamae]